MNRTTNMKDSDDTNNCAVKDEGSTGGVGFINRRLQQFERKSMTLKPPIKPKPNIDSMNRPNFTRVESLNKIRLELEKKIKTERLEKPLHPKEPPKSVEKINSLKKSFTLPQKCSSGKSIKESINFVKNDSFLAEITAKMVMRSDSSTSRFEESIEKSQNILVSDRNNVHHIKSQMKTNPVEAISFLHKKNREWSHENQIKTTQNFVDEHEAEEEAEYELVPEKTRDSIHNLHGRINVPQKETGSFLYKNSASCDKKYDMNHFKKIDQQEPEEEAEYELMPENNRNSNHNLHSRIDVPQKQTGSFLYKNSASCDKKYPMNNFKKLDQQEPEEEEAEYELMPENNRNSIHHLQGRINAPQEDNGSFLHRNSASCDKKHPINHNKNIHQEEPVEEAEYDIIFENNKKPPHLISTTDNYLYKNGELCNKIHDQSSKKPTHLDEPAEEAEYALIVENDNYVMGAQRSNDNYSLPFDMNNNNGSGSYERLVENSSPIYNEIESDEENIYQVIGFHKPSEHDTNQDDFGFTNLRDPNKSINVSAVNEYCKQTDTNSARNIQGSPVSTEKYQR